MSRKRTTTQILKERLSVLAVIVSCLMLVIMTQGARQFFTAQKPPPTATSIAAATLSPTATKEPEATGQAAPRPAPATTSSSSSPATPAKPLNLTGRWHGTFSEVVDGVAYDYNYTLELSQQGTFIAGKSIIEKQDDPGTFARFVVRGQIVSNTDPTAIKITEDLLGAQKLRSGSAAAPRNTQLSYISAQDGEYLEGEWVDKRYSTQDVSGTIRLTRQP